MWMVAWVAVPRRRRRRRKEGRRGMMMIRTTGGRKKGIGKSLARPACACLCARRGRRDVCYVPWFGLLCCVCNVVWALGLLG